jgi:N-acetylneuraminic acid mutarotase
MKKAVVALTFVLMLSISLFYGLSIQVEAGTNLWATKESMPEANPVGGATAVNGKIYVFLVNGNTFEYNPSTDTWTAKEPIPTPRIGFATTSYQNKIYTIGGSVPFDVYAVPTSLVEVYDPASNTWETREPMPTNRSYLSASVVDGKIYAIGGIATPYGSYFSTATEVYDTANNSWSTETPLPTGVYRHAAAVVNNKIYVLGGSDQVRGDSLELNQIYDPQKGEWSTGMSLPVAVSGSGVGVTSGVMAPKRIYIIGGYVLGEQLEGINKTQVYNPQDDTWTFGADMPTERYSLKVAVVDDKLYAIGGYAIGDSPAFMVNEEYTPIWYVPESPDDDDPAMSTAKPFSTTLVIASIAVLVIGVGLLAYFRKRRREVAKT